MRDELCALRDTYYGVGGGGSNWPYNHGQKVKGNDALGAVFGAPGGPMPHRKWIEPIVEKAVNQVLENYAAQMRVEIVQRVMRRWRRNQRSRVCLRYPSPRVLARAISDIQASSSQKDILRALLDSCASCAARTALFVVKADRWLDGRHEVSAMAMHQRFCAGYDVSCRGPSARRPVCGERAGIEFDANFFEQFGAPTGEARLLPLILKDKVAALVYADGGANNGRSMPGQSRCWCTRRAHGWK